MMSDDELRSRMAGLADTTAIDTVTLEQVETRITEMLGIEMLQRRSCRRRWGADETAETAEARRESDDAASTTAVGRFFDGEFSSGPNRLLPWNGGFLAFGERFVPAERVPSDLAGGAHHDRRGHRGARRSGPDAAGDRHRDPEPRSPGVVQRRVQRSTYHLRRRRDRSTASAGRVACAQLDVTDDHRSDVNLAQTVLDISPGQVPGMVDFVTWSALPAENELRTTLVRDDLEIRRNWERRHSHLGEIRVEGRMDWASRCSTVEGGLFALVFTYPADARTRR